MNLKKLGLKSSMVLAAIIVVNFTSCGGGGGSSEERSCDLVLETREVLLPYSDNPYYNQQWYLHYDSTFYNSIKKNYTNINPDPNAHIHPWPDQAYTGKGIKIAVIDSALDIHHEDLKGAVVKAYDIATKTENICPFSNELNHGTEVTGVIAASSNDKGIAGVAPESEIFFIRLPFSTDSDGNDITNVDIINAFEQAYDWQADVINCSWGTNNVDESVKKVIQDVAKYGRNGKGTIIVFAAGNTATNIGNDESAIDEVIAVGATNIQNQRSQYSNYGDALDIMAPGGQFVGITTLDQMGTAGQAPGDSNYLQYDDDKTFGGTSASAPIVTGVVALMLQKNPDLNRTEVYDLLIRHAEKFDSVNCQYDIDGHSDLCGYGKVHVENVLNAI